MAIKKIVKVFIAITTIAAAVMELIDSSIVNVAFNQIAGNLGATIEDVSWVITSYAIANVIIIPMTGFLSEYFGRKQYYMASIVIFTLASIFCGLSSSIWVLVFWRFIQGLAGGGLLSTSQSILFDTFQKEEQAMAGALFGMGMIIGPTLGPFIGGLIIDNYSWPLIFYINIPFGIVASWLTYKFIDNGNVVVQKPSIDWTGICLLVVGIGSLQYMLDKGASEDWFDSSYIIWATVVTIICIPGFIWWELRQKSPVVNLHILKDRSLSTTTILTFMAGFALMTSLYVFPLLLQRTLGYTAYETGITLLPSLILFLFIMPIIGKRLQAGTSPKVFITMGFLALVGFGLLMSQADVTVSSSFFFLPLMIRGAGLGLLIVPLTTLAVQGLKPQDIPQGIAINNMMRQLGGAFGIAIINNYIIQRLAVHRTDLVSNIYDSNSLFIERTTAIAQNLQTKLAVTAGIKEQSLQYIDQLVIKQSFFLTYLDAFLISSLGVLIVIPLMFFAKSNPVEAGSKKSMIDGAH